MLFNDTEWMRLFLLQIDIMNVKNIFFSLIPGKERNSQKHGEKKIWQGISKLIFIKKNVTMKTYSPLSVYENWK